LAGEVPSRDDPAPGQARTLSAIALWSAQEITMAKGQKRGNRETRKPKTKKEPPVANVSNFLTRGTPTPVSLPKKKS
jgi:hypothetical protein